ncbi:MULTISPECIES: peptide-binding protein [unclassified Thioalkalivibrio]|uniref:peptide-binding protein n=1 Tax=unclassified Thioalkalivibrio TaxID=2621013 RepID=UPI00037694F5|nr:MULTISPECIES: peptide-binding protein [unclassified Thioalkalivibrio]
MSRHFGWIVTLIVLGILLLLVMVQIDRQWQRMASMQNTMSEQARDLRALRRSLQGLESDLASGRFAGMEAEQAPRADAVPSAFRRAARAAEQEDYAEGDWLVQAFGTGLATITPYVSSDAYASEVQNYVLESLVVRDPDTLEWQGLLAESWEFDDSGTELTFRLRSGPQFSDGEPLTAEDVEFTFDFLMTDAIAVPRSRAFLEKVEAVEAVDERTVRFVFEEPFFDAMRVAGGLDVLPKHFYERYLEDPETFNESRGILLGSGPYRLEDPTGWTPDAGRIELERNPRYWGPIEPPLDRLVWRVIQNDSARLTTFRNRDIDVYGARPREYARLRDDEALRERADTHEYMSPTAGYSYIAWNQQRNGEPTRFADPRVRKAMSYLTDVDRLIEEVMLGYAERAISPFSPRSDQHNPDLEPIPFDVERALELLAEAGYRERNRDGVLVNEDGEPFSFELAYFQDNEDTRRIALFLRDLYARAGVEMRPQPTEWSVMLEKLSRQDFDAITLGWTSGVEVDIYQMFHSSQTVSGGDNFIHYQNPELDAIIEAARGEVDEPARMELWREAERILHEDQPYTFLMRRQTLAFIDRRIQNLEQTALGLNLGAVPLEIYVPFELQRYGQ